MNKQNNNGHCGFRRKPLIMALESRILLDGAAVVTAAEALSDVALQTDAAHSESAEQSMHFAAPAPTASEAPARREVAFVDTSVDGYESLLNGLPEGVEAILVDGSQNGLEQIVAALQGQTGIDAIHLFSHGDVGELQLGNLTLTAGNLESNADLLSTLGQSLTENGDLMLYGCYVGADSEGQNFIDAVAELTRADVAASEDLTGAESLGGDWDLEAESGAVETLELSSATFEGVLAPTVSAVADSVTYTEGDAPVTIDTGISFSGGGDYREGYIRFTVENATAGDQFTLQDAPDVNADGAISVVGIDVYRGNGAGRERIGSIDSVENGVDGQPLKILLSTPLPNSGFEEGSTNWTLSSEIYGDNAGEISFDNFSISLATNSDFNSTYTGGTGTTNVQASSGSFNPQASISTGTGVDGTQALYLRSSGNIARTDQDPFGAFQADGYGSIHGPYATSTVITVEDGDSISLDFKAVGNSDDYEVFGLLRRVDANGDFLSDNPNDATNNVILFAERGADTAGFVRVDKTGLSSGEYRFQFVGGTYDATGGLAVGSNLYVDNIRLISSQQVTDTIASTIASQVTYQSTADDTEVERNITISAMDSAGGTGSDTIILMVEQRNNAPAFSGDGILAPVNEDTVSPAGNTVGSLFDSLFDDPDTSFTPADSLVGIIVTDDGSDATEGEWQYTTDGSTWYAVGDVANDNGLVLSRDASLRFVATADYSGTPGSLSVHAVDSTDSSINFTNGASRESFDTTATGLTGGDTAVSAGAVNLNTSIAPVNDAPVMVAPTGGAITDSADYDDFADLTGTLAATDIDSSVLTYGIDGGSDGGTYVTLAGAYGTLQVTKATGAYTFFPSSSAINGLNTNESQAFTVTVSDGELTGSQVLEFTLEGANDSPVFEADSGPTQVSVFSYPNLNGTDATPNRDNENANLASIVQWVINEGGYYTLDTAIQNFTDADFADKLNASGFFFMTDMERADPNSDLFLPESAKADIRSWVDAGGVIMMTGTAGSDDTDFLNSIFYWDLTTEGGSSWELNETNASGTAFSEGPASLSAPSATDAIGRGTVDGFKAIYGDDSSATVATIGYGAGTVIFMGYDYYSSGIAGTGFTDTATQYGEDVSDGATTNDGWVREIIPRALQYSADLSSGALLTESDSTLSSSGQLRVSDIDQPDSVTVSVSGVLAEQRGPDGLAMATNDSQPSVTELLAMLDTGSQPSIDSTATSGDVSWTFNSSGEKFDYLAAGESLVLTYELTADDGNGGTATRTLNITVNGTNDAPVSQGATQDIAENGIYTGVVNATDVDGTIADYALVSDVTSGSLSFNSDGSYSFDPGTAFDDLAEGETAAVTFTYRATDNTGAASQVATVTLTVVGSNDVPVVSAGSGTAAENGSLSSNVPAASDVDGTIASYQVVTDVAEGELTFNSDGTYTFAGDSDFDDLAVGESREVSFTYTATDNDGAVSAPGTVTFTVTGTNDAPTISAEAAAPITEVPGDSSAQGLSDSGEIIFEDLDTTDLVDVTYASNNDIAWSGATVAEPLNSALASALVGGFSIPATSGAAAPGSVDWTYALNDVDLDFLAAGETISFSYMITATDSQGATDTDVVTFTITGSNDAPTISAAAADPITEAPGDSSAQDLSDSGEITFDDLDTTDLVDVTYASNNDIAWSGATVPEPLNSALASALVGGFSILATSDAAAPGSVSWAYDVSAVDLDFLAAGETLTFSYDITATDSQNATASDTVTFTITGTNDAPTINAEAADAITETPGDSSAQDLSDTGVVSFDDLDATDVVDITFAGNNDISWSGGSLDSALASTLVGGFSIPATSDAAAPGSVDWTYDVSAVDLDFLAAGETLTFSYDITATDSQNATATDTVTFTITGTNDAPTISAEAAAPITETPGDSSAQDLSDSGVVSFDDLDTTDVVDITFASNNDISWSGGSLDTTLASALVSGFSIPATAGAAAPGSVDWSYDVSGVNLDFLAAGETLSFSYTLTATDSEGATDTAEVSFTITGTNDAPTISAEAAAPITETPGDSSAQDLSDTGVISFDDLDATDVVDISFADNGDISWSGGALTETQKTALLGGFSIPVTTDAAAPGSVNWTYALNDMNLDFLAASETLTFSYDITATDSQNATATDTVTFTITGTNDAPTITAEAADVITEVVGDSSAQNLKDSGRVSFDDLDANDTLAITAASNNDLGWRAADGSVIASLPTELAERLLGGFSVPQPVGVEAPGELNWRYIVDNVDLDFLAEDSTISFSYTLTATDNQGASSSSVISLVIRGTNDGPVVDALDIDRVWQLGRPFELDVAQRFSDADHGETLTYSVTGLPGGLVYDQVSGVISGASTEPGVFSVRITATDTQGASISRSFGLTVTALVPETDAPVPAPTPQPLPDSTPAAPIPTGDTDTGGGINPGLIQTGPTTNIVVDGVGFIPPVTPGGGSDSVDAGESSADAAPVTGNSSGSLTAESNDTVLLSEEGAVAIATTGADGRTSVRASVDVSVSSDGVVNFNDAQQEAFSIVGLTISAIDRSDSGNALVRIQDTNSATSAQEYSGSLGSGESLPEWISVNRNTGAVSISTPPENVREVVIRVQAMGSDGQVRILEMKLDLDELFRRAPASDWEVLEQEEAMPETGFVPLQGQFETELQARDGYGDQLLRLLQSA